MAEFNLVNKIKITNPVANIDYHYGPYESLEAALESVPSAIRAVGRTIGIISNGTVVDYCWKSGITDNDLIIKEPTRETLNIYNIDNTADLDKPVSTAQKAYVDAETSLREEGDQALTDALEAVASGSPKGSYANEAALKSADPDHTYTYVTIDTGKWYYWDTVLEDWEIGGDYQAPLDIVGELGTSETKVINQKVVSEEIAKRYNIYNSNIYTISDLAKRSKMLNISLAIKEIYISKSQTDIVLGAISRNADGNKWYIRFYTLSGTVLFCSTNTFTVTPENSGLTFMELFNSTDSSICGYILIDWSILPDGTLYNGMTSSDFKISNKVFDINNSPSISANITWKSDIINDVTTGGSSKLLSAEMGRLLNSSSKQFPFKTIPATTKTKLFASFIKELYLYDAVEKNKETVISAIRRNVSGVWEISLYNKLPSFTYACGFTLAITEGAGLTKHNLLSGTSTGLVRGIIIVDWKVLSDGYSTSLNTGSEYILSDNCWDIKSSPTIYADSLTSVPETIDTDSFVLKRTLYSATIDSVVNSANKAKMEIISAAILDVWFNAPYQELRICSISRGYTGDGWYVRFYNSSTVLVSQYFSATNPETYSGISLVPLVGTITGYLLIDWTKIEIGVRYTGMTDNDFKVNSILFELNPNTQIGQLVSSVQLYKFGNYDNSFQFDDLFATKLGARLFECYRNFNVPTVGAFMSGDNENWEELNDAATVEQLQKAYVNYLYIDGVKRGTLILFDQITGDPFYFDAVGTKKYLTTL